MKFIVKYISKENIQNLMREAGYRFLRQDNEKTELAFIRPLARSGYPRFHLFITENKNSEEISFNLHLDQKKPIYRNTTAHNADYTGEIIENEAERIKEFFQE